MNIESIRPMDGTPNVYIAVVDGVQMMIGTKPDQSPESVLLELAGQSLEQPNYAEKRTQEYPPVQDQLDMIYHDIEAWRAKIAAIKARHPKG